MMFKVMEVGDGVEIEGETGSIRVYLEPVKQKGDVHIKSDKESSKSGMCDVVGDTYNHKDKIKKLPYGKDGTEWTGDVWCVNKGETANLAAVLKIAAVDVTLDARCIATDDSWGELQEEIDLPGEENESIRVMRGPEGPENKVSRSWAEDAAKVGRYESPEDFARKFGLEIVPDEEIMEYHDLDVDDEDVEVFNSDTAV